MGEIKSTLDLVMERTRHLTLSDEEKQQQRREEGGKRLQGLLQQYADGALNIAQLDAGMRRLQDEFDVDAPRQMVADALGRIDPDQENRQWLALLRDAGPAETLAGTEAALADYRTERRRMDADQAEAARERLAAAGIAGTAVVPNPDAEPVWQQAMADLRRRFDAKIAALAPPSPDGPTP